ncbi:MAG: VanZ family protein [Cyanobacteriota bacterium]|nr:VanZ family protein [Cyanobacteriota bacterium]
MTQRTWILICLGYLTFFLAIVVAANFGKLPLSQLQRIPYYDAIAHFFLYGTATVLIHRACNRKMRRLWGILIPWGPFLFTLFAVAEEALQLVLSHRSASFIDLSADLCGIALFYWASEQFDRHR